jgi:RNA recognition motif-containing protein
MKNNKTRSSFNDPANRFTKIYVGNLVYSVDEGGIHNLFSKYGKVGKIEVIRDPKTNKSKGIAFLQMYNKDHAKMAIFKLNGSSHNGRTLKVSVALERSTK